MQAITHYFTVKNGFYQSITTEAVSQLNKIYLTIQTIAKRIFSFFFETKEPKSSESLPLQITPPPESKEETSIHTPEKTPRFTNKFLNKKFFRSNYQEPSQIIGDHFTDHEYIGYSVLRKKASIHPETGILRSCDIIRCIKRDFHIRYDTNRFSIWDYFWNISRVKRCIQRQKEMLPPLLEKIQPQIRNWNYDDFCFCDSEDLQKKAHLPNEEAQKYHQFFFFHREATNC